MMYFLKGPQPGRVYLKGRLPHLPRVKAKFRVRIINRGHRITNYMRKWENQFLRRSGAAIRTYVIRAFEVVADKNISSTPGTAPYLHQSKVTFIKRAILYCVDYTARETVVGPVYSVAKLWGWKHEHGKIYGKARRSRGETSKPAHYPPRPFMGPPFRKWWGKGRLVIMHDIRRKMRAGN